MASSTPPLTSPSHQPSSSQDAGLSSGPITPQGWRNSVRFLHCAFDSDEEEEEEDDIDMLGGHGMYTLRKTPLTPTRGSKLNRLPSAVAKTKVSPSRFVVKGTVTPSRAAPLFTNGRRKRVRTTEDEEEENARGWADENEDVFFEEANSSPSKDALAYSTVAGLKPGLLNARSRSFVPTMQEALPPLMPLPLSLTRRPHAVHTNVSSFMHALRSNNLAHLSFASSTSGISAFATAGRGVLSAARSLGAGVPGAAHRNISLRSFHQTFCTTSTPSTDLFTLPSGQDDQRFSHPLCAEYAHSARCLNGSHAAQWLALGSNEGRLSLLNTSEQGVGEAGEPPSWSAHDGSVFEVKWRCDDEQIATGGSDYNIRVWDTCSGQPIRSFSGHRGTPRSIAWDPDGRGYLLASGGRDGGIHLYDTRVDGRRGSVEDGDGPIASIWGAHAAPVARRVKGKPVQPIRGITSLAYLPGRGAGMLCSAACADGTLKLWDMRNLNAAATAAEQPAAPSMVERSVDVSTRLRPQNKSPHGISSLVAGSSKLFAACTDGCIYTLSTASLSAAPPSTSVGLPAVPLYDAAQRGNTLYARMALHDDERTLALGCNSGVIAVWDTHAATSAASELTAMGEDVTKMGNGGTAHTLSGYAQGHEHLVQCAKPAILRGGHRSNFEINAVSWAHGQNGPTLASVSDDFTVRLWRPSVNL